MTRKTVGRVVAAVSVGALAAFVAMPGVARACSFRSNQWMTDPAEVGVDTSPPSKPTAGAVQLQRGTTGGCGGSGSSCDDLGILRFNLSATDDRTPADNMGFRLTVTRGAAPDGLLSAPDMRTFEGEMTLVWLDGRNDSQESLDFDIEIQAVDLGGNVSAEATTVHIRQDTGGCSLGRGSRTNGDGGGVAMATLGIAWAMLMMPRPRRPR